MSAGVKQSVISMKIADSDSKSNQFPGSYPAGLGRSSRSSKVSQTHQNNEERARRASETIRTYVSDLKQSRQFSKQCAPAPRKKTIPKGSKLQEIRRIDEGFSNGSKFQDIRRNEDGCSTKQTANIVGFKDDHTSLARRIIADRGDCFDLKANEIQRRLDIMNYKH